MAYIDKIYGTREQWEELKSFLSKHKKDALKYLYRRPPKGATEAPLCNFPKEVDDWLMKNCPLEFVLRRLKEQHGFFENYYQWLDV